MHKLLFLGILCLTLVLNQQFISAQSIYAEKGWEYYNQDDYKKAMDYFSKHLLDYPKDAKVLHARATIYSYYSEYAKAFYDVNNSIKYYSKKDKKGLVEAYLLRSDIYSKGNNLDKAINDVNFALKIDAHSTNALLYRATYYSQKKEYSKANEDFESLIKQNKYENRAYTGLAKNYFEQNQYLKVIDILTKFINISPDYPMAYIYRAEAQAKLGNNMDAISDFIQCLAIDQLDQHAWNRLLEFTEKYSRAIINKLDSKVDENTNEIFWYQMRANFYEKSGNYNKAISDYEKILEIMNGSNPFIFSKLGFCNKEKGNYNQAIENYKKAIAIDPNDEDLYIQMGEVKWIKGDLKGAVDDFSKAIEIDPSYAWPYYRRGLVEIQTKEFGNALDDYNQAIEIDPTRAYTYYYRAQLYEQINNPQKAKLDYERAASWDSIVYQQNNCKQFALFSLGKQTQATEFMNEILKQYPNKANFYDAACLYSLIDEKKSAIKYLEIALQKGYDYFDLIRKDKNLENIRELPEFISLLKKYESSKKSAKN